MGRPKGTPEPYDPQDCPQEGCSRTLASVSGLTRHLRVVHDVIPSEKKCRECKEVRPIHDFAQGSRSVDSKGRLRYRSNCFRCHNKLSQARKGKRSEAEIRRDKTKAAAQRFGVTLADYEGCIALAWEEQEGRCKICQVPLVRGGARHEREYLDHCHVTMRVRGLLCLKCNLALGYLGDSAEVARSAASYLEDESPDLLAKLHAKVDTSDALMLPLE